MASLIFAHAKSIYNKKKRYESELRDIHGLDFDTTNATNNLIEAERTRFKEILAIAQLLHEDYVEATGAKAHNWHFVTVRPKPGVTFEEFYILTYKFVNRSFMLDYKLVFEQKNPEGNGEGFHMHMICSTKHRSKGELLRDAKSSYAKVADENCVCVKPTRNPEEMFTKYCIEYQSDDDHKIATKNGDAIWRTKMNLADVYENDLPRAFPLLSSSSGQKRNVVIELH